MDKLQTLNTLLEMTKEAEELASEGGPMERIDTLVAEIRRKAQQEHQRVRGDHGRGQFRELTRYELCMIGIREEIGRGNKPRPNIPALSASFSRIHEEIDRTITEIEAKRSVM